MFFDTYKALHEDGSEAAFDTKEVKDVAAELNDMLDDIPEADVDETTNGGIPFTAEMCRLVESAAVHSGKKRYLLELADLVRLMEDGEIEDAGEAVEAVADANSGTDPDTGEDVNIQQADVVVIVPSTDEAKEIVADAVEEAALTGGKKGPASKKLDGLTGAVKELKNKGIKVARAKSKK